MRALDSTPRRGGSGRKGARDARALRNGFDWCLASVHDHFELDRAAQTRRIVTAMRDPSVRMIGHLSARMIGRRPAIDLDLDAIVAAAERPAPGSR
jgi:histidinol phosphatase-like PHP family hydrolase